MTVIIDTGPAPRFEVEVYHDRDPYIPQVGDKFVIISVSKTFDKYRLCDVHIARLEIVEEK